MSSSEHATLARAVVNRWNSHRGSSARDVSSLAAFPLLAEIYALAEGGQDDAMFCFHEIEALLPETIHVAGEDAPREVLVFADFMIYSHEYGVDVATGEVFMVGIGPYLIAPTLEAFSKLYVADSDALFF